MDLYFKSVVPKTTVFVVQNMQVTSFKMQNLEGESVFNWKSIN